MIGYDIDGVLTTKVLPSEKKWGRMNGPERQAHKAGLITQYRAASPLLVPTEPFIAISARKDTDDVRAITTEWLYERYPDLVKAIHLLPISRSIENVVNFKNAIITDYGLTTFTEDNKKVLKGLHLAGCPAQLFFWEEGMTQPVPYIEVM